MSTLSETLKKLKNKDTLNLTELRDTILQIAKDIISQRFEEIKQEAEQEIEELKDELSASLEEITSKTFKGDRGEKGDKGDRGEKGDSIQGLPGKNGKDGKNGNNGIDGKDGKNGNDGKSGKDGIELKPQEIVSKLESLEGSSRLSKSAIKGLEESLPLLSKNIQESKKGGGGGMGNIQHESFNVSSATTTLTTSYKIAGNGTAIMGVFYNGQQIFYGTHYTISGKIINLQFTPEDDTTITI